MIRAGPGGVSPNVNPDDCARLAALAPSAAVGALEPDDAAFVREHLATCARPHPELRDAMTVAAAIGWAVPDEDMPSPSLRGRILERARAEARPATLPAAIPHRADAPGAAASAGLLRWLTAGATAVAAAALLGIAVLVAETGSLRTEIAEADRDLVAARAELAEAEAWIGRAVANGANAYFMDGIGSASLASFMLVVEDDASGALLLMSGLPALAEGETYELWVERDGAVIGVGTFAPDEGGRAALAIDASVAGIRQAMITVEPSGGSAAPNPDGVIMQGELST